jgi:hypothetical protein
MATRWRRRLAERSLARRNRFIPRQRTWFVRFKENLIPTRCEQVVSGLISTFWRPHFQRLPLTASCGSVKSIARAYQVRARVVEREKSAESPALSGRREDISSRSKALG